MEKKKRQSGIWMWLRKVFWWVVKMKKGTRIWKMMKSGTKRQIGENNLKRLLKRTKRRVWRKVMEI